MLEGAALMSSEAKAQWSAIGARADKGRGTLDPAPRRRDAPDRSIHEGRPDGVDRAERSVYFQAN